MNMKTWVFAGAGAVCGLLASAAAAGGLADDFEQSQVADRPANWTTDDDWYVAKWGDNNLVENIDHDGRACTRWLRHEIETPATGAWQVDFKYDWHWGGDAKKGLGNYTFLVMADMLDSRSNGCGVVVHQGTCLGGTANGLIEIRTVKRGEADRSLASGPGYGRAGWKSMDLKEPALYPVRLACDGHGVLTAYRDVGNGWEVVASATSDVRAVCTHIRIGASGWDGTETPQIDDVEVKIIP